MEERLRVGVITSPHGIQGEVKVFATTDEPEAFKRWKEVVLVKNKEEKVLDITGVKYFKQFVILRFKQVTNRDEAERLRQAELYIPRAAAAPCEENENFIVDLIGLSVVTDEGQELGKCTDVLQTGANDVYEVTMQDGKELLIPAIRECILKVDLDAGIMQVHLLDGLLDI